MHDSINDYIILETLKECACYFIDSKVKEEIESMIYLVKRYLLFHLYAIKWH